jgi:hypothetical protein
VLQGAAAACENQFLKARKQTAKFCLDSQALWLLISNQERQIQGEGSYEIRGGLSGPLRSGSDQQRLLERC